MVFLAQDLWHHGQLTANVTYLLEQADLWPDPVRVYIGVGGSYPNPGPTVKIWYPQDVRGTLRAALVALDATRPVHLSSFDWIGAIRQALVAGEHAYVDEWRTWVDGQAPAYWEPIPAEVLLAGESP